MPEPVIQYYEVLPAGIKPYDPRAIDVAARVTDLLRGHIPGLRVEHIGSTAVPNCEGKGYIDLLIPFANDDELSAIKAALAALGFQHQATKIVFPETRPMRTGVIEHDGHRFRLHVHVVPGDGEEFRSLLMFRDKLRADPELARAYAAKKRALVEAGITESPDYAVAKGGFVQSVLTPAKDS